MSPSFQHRRLAARSSRLPLAWLPVIPALLLAVACSPTPGDGPSGRTGSGTAGTAGSDLAANLSLEVPATTFTLSNGLTVVVHSDHSAPLVAVNVTYHVGSKNEPAGKSGYAHLFEHLMFNGSEHFNDDFFKATQRIGATEQNGTTSVDRTNYYQTVPKAALDSILWLESDRMGHLLGAVDQAKLDEQREVVKNEKRQSDNRPYAKGQDLAMRATMPAGHPYAHSTIGSMEDLDAASLEDMHEWFRTWYGPSNAVLVLSGDVTVDEARAKAQQYFGDLDPGTPVGQPERWLAPLADVRRETAYDRVAQPQVSRVWNVSEYASPDTDYLQILGLVLAGDKNARLYKRLVIDEALVTDVSAGVWNRQLGGQFMVTATLKPEVSPDQVETILDEELHRVLKDGPTADELVRLRTSTLAAQVRSLESIAGKAALLAESQTFLGSADAWHEAFDRLREATPADVQRVGQQWLGADQGHYTLRILPFGQLSAEGAGVDRSVMPMPAEAVPATFPATERATLDNGMQLVVARRAGVPLANMTLLLRTGVSAGDADIASGTGSLAMDLLDEATSERSGEQLVEALGRLGAELNTGGGGELSYASMSAMTPVLRDSLALFAEVVRRPAFAQADFERLQAKAKADVAATRESPGHAVRRLVPAVLYGPDHPYGRLVTEQTLDAIDRQAVLDFHSRWFHPNNATLVVSGDVSLQDLRPLVEEAFAGWVQGSVPETLAPPARPAEASVVYLVDKPGAPQSVIQAVLMASRRGDGDEIARRLFNTGFGGSFTSRLNMKLREEKGWAYGAGSGFSGTLGARTFAASSSVQADRTADSMLEIAALLKQAATTRPLTDAELAAARDTMTLGLSSDWASSEGIALYLMDQQVNGLPDDYYDRYPGAVRATPASAVQAEAARLLDQPVTWVVMGDRRKVEASIRALNLGQVRVVDADGKPVD